eukprot:1194302-Prorocentrum_minimum.AAC.4
MTTMNAVPEVPGLRQARLFLDVARPPSRDPPPGDRLPGPARTDLKSGRASERDRATSRNVFLA